MPTPGPRSGAMYELRLFRQEFANERLPLIGDRWAAWLYLEGGAIKAHRINRAVRRLAIIVTTIVTITGCGSPATAEQQFDVGMDYKTQARWQEALGEFDAAIRLDPNYADAYLMRGYVYNALGEFGSAIQDYDEAIGLGQGYIVFANRGVAYSRLGQYERAIQDFDEAIRRNPGDPALFLEWAGNYGYLRNYERALQDDNEAIRLQPAPT